MTSRQPWRVTIAMLTFHRPDQIAEAVRAARRQCLDLDPAFEGDVLVVDNDPAGSARTMVEAAGHDPSGADAPVRYVVEPTPGIAAARNRALREAADRRLIAFIDDDGRPGQGWLRGLLRTWQDYDRPAAVAGFVDTHYDGPVDDWIRAGRFFQRVRRATGTPMRAAACGNLLLDLDQLRDLGVAFDERLGLAGGEDTLLTRTLTARGGRIVASADATVIDIVAADRINRRWVLRRALAHGNTAGLLEIAFGGRSARARVGGAGLARVAAGTAAAGAGTVLRRQRMQARGLRLAARGLGFGLAASSVRYLEYARGGASSRWGRAGASGLAAAARAGSRVELPSGGR